MSNLKTYIDYFRQLAVKHAELQHNPASETGDADIGSKRFAKWSADEALTGLRTKLSFPALLVELYENETQSDSPYEVRQRPHGAITVVAHSLPENFSSEEDAYDTAERIIYGLLQKIWADHYGPDINRCATPFREINLNFPVVPVGPLFDNEYGFRVEFAFEFHQVIDIASPPRPGTFMP